MAEFGLTGGIGSGKSSVSTRLQALGAAIVDADAVVRELQQSGTDVFNAIVAHFGDGFVANDGELDRQAIADVVFTNEAELQALNAIVHPAVRVEMDARRVAFGESHRIVVLDIPLLVESRYRDLAGVVVVDVPVDLAIERLVTYRGFSEDDARARMANQISRDERNAQADFVIDNSGDLAHLDGEVQRCWAFMQERIRDIVPTSIKDGDLGSDGHL